MNNREHPCVCTSPSPLVSYPKPHIESGFSDLRSGYNSNPLMPRMYPLNTQRYTIRLSSITGAMQYVGIWTSTPPPSTGPDPGSAPVPCSTRIPAQAFLLHPQFWSHSPERGTQTQRDRKREENYGLKKLASGEWAPTSVGKGQGRIRKWKGKSRREGERENVWGTHLPPKTLPSTPQPAGLPHQAMLRW